MSCDFKPLTSLIQTGQVCPKPCQDVCESKSDNKLVWFVLAFVILTVVILLILFALKPKWLCNGKKDVDFAQAFAIAAFLALFLVIIGIIVAYATNKC